MRCGVFSIGGGKCAPGLAFVSSKALKRRLKSSKFARPEGEGRRLPSLKFGRFEVQPVERRVRVDGVAARLGARAFDLLLALIENRERVVGKNELLDRVWAGLVVEEANLHMQVSTLRKLLGAGAIATVPGRGYCFSASVEAVDDMAADAPVPAPARSAHISLIGRIGRSKALFPWRQGRQVRQSRL